jgi:hypothetical protein
MNTWIIAAIVLGLLVAGSLVAVNFIGADSGPAVSVTQEKSCGACSGDCQANGGCGLASCGATEGKPCGCGKA